MSPTSQTGKTIGFALLRDGQPLGGVHDLVVRPQSLVLTEPNRIMVHQTLGGAYVDDFGAGVAQLLIEGTEGWRGAPNCDGAEQFQRLRSLIGKWTTLRADCIKAQQSPESVELAYIDALNNLRLGVVPHEFTLQRSINPNPLLLRYRLRFSVMKRLDEAESLADTIAGGGLFGKLQKLLDGLRDAISKQGMLGALWDGAKSILGGLATAAKKFLSFSRDLLNLVTSGINAVTGFISETLRPWLILARDVQQAGRNLFAAIGRLAGLPNALLAQCAATIGALTSGWCALSALPAAATRFNLDALYGASNCSSTSGGRPASNLTGNLFERIIPTASAPVATTTTTRAVAAAARLDPLSRPLTAGEITGLLQSAAGATS